MSTLIILKNGYKVYLLQFLLLILFIISSINVTFYHFRNYYIICNVVILVFLFKKVEAKIFLIREIKLFDFII